MKYIDFIMKKIIFTLLLLCFSINIFSQNNCKGYGMDIDYQLSFSLELNNDNKYYIRYIIELTKDIIYSSIYSYGNYTYKDKLLILNDKNINFDIQMFVDNDTLIPINSPVFWNKNNRFIIEYLTCGDINNIISPLDSMYNMSKFDTSNEVSFEGNILLGRYSNGDIVTIKFNIDSTYIVTNEYFRISKGRWETKKNKIILFDEYLNHEFIGTILKEDKIKINLPECFGKDIFKRN